MANNKTKNSENSYYGWIFVIAVVAVYVYNKFGLSKWINPNQWDPVFWAIFSGVLVGAWVVYN